MTKVAPVEVGAVVSAPQREPGTPSLDGLALILSMAMTVRVLGLNSASMWFDEAISKYRALMPLRMYAVDYSDFVGANAWELILRPFAWGPPWLFRVPSLIAALIAVSMGWKVMQLLAFSRAQQMTAAIPMILLPGLIWQAQDARYYGAIGALYMGAIYLALSRRPLGLLACIGILPYVHPVGAFYGVAALVVAWLAGMQSGRILRIGLLGVVAWTPRTYTLIWPSGTRPIFWVGQFNAEYVVHQTAQAFAVGTMDIATALLLLGLLIAAILLAVVRLRQRNARILLAAAMLPIIGLLAASVRIPVYFYRPVQPVLIPFCLLIGLTLAPRQKWYSKIGAGIGAAVLVVGILNWDPAARGGHLDAGAAFISEHWQAGDRIAHASATTAVPLSFYLSDRAACIIEGYGPDRLPSNLVLPYCDAIGSWLVWAREPIMQPELTAQLMQITARHMPVWTSVNTWHIAPIEIYYLP